MVSPYRTPREVEEYISCHNIQTGSILECVSEVKSYGYFVGQRLQVTGEAPTPQHPLLVVSIEDPFQHYHIGLALTGFKVIHSATDDDKFLSNLFN